MSAKIAVNLLGQRRYWPMWVAQVLGAFNDNLFRYSLLTLAAYQSWTVIGLEPAAMTAVATAAFTVPIFLFSAIAGQVSDRFDRTRIMRFTKFAEIWLMLIAAAGFLLEQPLLLIVTLFLMGIQSAFFIPARNSAMPTLLEPRELVTGNALMSGPINIVILAGAIGGTLLVSRGFGPEVIASMLVGFAIIGWLAVRQNDSAPASNPHLKVSWNIFGQTWKMLQFAFRDGRLLRPMLGVAWFWMIGAAVLTVLPNFVRETLGGSESVLAVCQVLFSVGAAIGALICGVLNKGKDGINFAFIGAIGLVIFPVDLLFYTLGSASAGELTSAAAFLNDPDNWRILFDLIGAAVSGGLFLVPLQAMVQRRAAPEIRGRVLAANGILNGLTATIGPFVQFGLVMAGLPLQWVFGFIALGSAGAALFMAFRIFGKTQHDT